MFNDVHFTLENKNIFWYSYKIQQQDRELLHKHRSMVFWFTGLSGSGKSTLASVLEQDLYRRSVSTYLLDGDNLRHGLCRDLDFTSRDRCEHVRRVGEVARLMFDAGLVVISTLISPYRFERELIRSKFPVGRFIEIFVDTPLNVCKERDPKGLYKKSCVGAISNFTGIHEVYEKPNKPDIHLDGQKLLVILIKELFNKIDDCFFI